MFATVIVVPMLLFSLAFVSLGNYLIGEKGELSGYTSIVGNYDTFDFDAVQAFQMAEQNPDQLQDVEFLQEIADKIHDMNVYLVVRRGEELYYASNETLAAADLSYLPAWEGEQRGEDSGQDGTLQGNAAAYEHRQTYAESAAVLTGQPGAGEEKKNGLSDTVQANAAGTQQQNQMIQAGKRSLLVRQLDFSFPDGAQGSLFIVMRIMGLISGKFLSGLFVSMLTILVFTAFLLTADEKLEREKQNRELISNISHDLKTPITSIKGYVEGLIDGVANTPEKQEKYIRTIYNKANDMDHLIDELTLYSRFESDRIPYNFHRLNVADYFGDCVEEIGMDMEAKGIELNYTNLVSPQTKIIADPEQMKRVINNIVGNSVKYMDKEKGRIDFRILDEHDSIRIEIEDNGQGIAARDLPKIFDRFYRTDSSRNSSRGGSGIGLSIVRKIIEDHGGYIWATSVEKEGTCMHFVIRKYIPNESDSGDSVVPSETEESMEDDI